jgi:hypothetical protein
LAGHSSVGGVIDHSDWEAEMRRITQSTFVFRTSLLTGIIFVLAAVLPMAALAGGGDPSGI